MQELSQAKEKIAQLSAQNARYVGLDSRLATALQEKEDMQQERNSALQAAKLADSRILSLKDKCGEYIFVLDAICCLIDIRQRSYRPKSII